MSMGTPGSAGSGGIAAIRHWGKWAAVGAARRCAGAGARWGSEGKGGRALEPPCDVVSSTTQIYKQQVHETFKIMDASAEYECQKN